MTWPQLVLGRAVQVALLAALAGIVFRGRYRESLSFPLYVLAVLVCDTLVALYPGRFYNGTFWILQQTLWDVLKLAVAVELGLRSFRAFPGARPVAYSAIAAALFAMAVVMLLAPAEFPTAYEVALRGWQPRIMIATVWLMTGIALLIVWYRIPVHEFQRAILIGFVPYLVVFVVILDLFRSYGFKLGSWLGYADAAAYLVASLYWARAAWRTEPALSIPASLETRLGAA